MQDVPYKATDEFEVKLKFEFRTKTTESNRVNLDPSLNKTSGPLPYLKATIVILKLTSGEYKARVEDVHGKLIASKKVEVNTELKFDLGFIDDLKDKTSSHEFIVNLIDVDKKSISRIVISFDEEGTYYVNGEKRGKV